MFGKKLIAVGCFLGSGVFTVPSLAADWVEWQHPGFHGGNGMLDVSVLARKNVDWAPNRWKAECSGRNAQGVDPVGTRMFQGVAIGASTPWANAILCTNSDEANGFGWTIDKFNRVVLDVSVGNDQRGTWQQNGDWAPQRLKAECPDGFAVTGLAQTAISKSSTTHVLCGKISVRKPGACWTASVLDSGANFTSSQDWFGWSVADEYDDYSFAGRDWNVSHYKVSCWADTYVAGVAMFPAVSMHWPTTLLCCQ